MLELVLDQDFVVLLEDYTLWILIVGEYGTIRSERFDISEVLLLQVSFSCMHFWGFTA